MAKQVHVLMSDDGYEKASLAVFRKKPTDKKLAELELYEGLETVQDVREAFEHELFWEKVYMY